MRCNARILLIVSLPALAGAQTETWQGGSSNWNNASNWDGGAVPLTPGFSAVINASGQTITLDTSATIDSLQLTAGTLTTGTQVLTLAPPDVSTPALTIGSATLNVNNDTAPGGVLAFNISGAPTGSIYTATGTAASIINVNSGQISISDGGAGNTLSLTGGGTINLSNNGTAPGPGVITGASGTETLTTDFTIQGVGSIQNLVMNLSGTVDSNAGGTLTLTPSAGGLNNTGTLQNTNGTLVLDNSLGGAIANNGSINVNSGTVQLQAMYGPSTSLTNTSVGEVNINDGGTFYVLPNYATTTIQNDGSINLLSSGSGTTLNLNSYGYPSAVTFTGSGSINMSDSPGNQIVGSSGAGDLSLTIRTIRSKALVISAS